MKFTEDFGESAAQFLELCGMKGGRKTIGTCVVTLGVFHLVILVFEVALLLSFAADASRTAVEGAIVTALVFAFLGAFLIKVGRYIRRTE